MLAVLLLIGLIVLVITKIFKFAVVLGIISLILISIITICKNRYFKSKEFIRLKGEVEDLVKDYNEISNYLSTVSHDNCFIPNKTKDNSHLASYVNTSNHNYKRDRHSQRKSDYKKNVYVHSCSLGVVKNSSREPIKYLCKYFNIPATQESVIRLNEIEENIYTMNNITENLNKRIENIEYIINPPWYIKSFFYDLFLAELNMTGISKLKPQYTTYIFQYVSNGGNS